MIDKATQKELLKKQWYERKESYLPTISLAFERKIEKAMRTIKTQ